MRRVCAEARCPDPPVYRGRCRRHARVQEQRTNRAGTQVYSTKRWKMTRRRILFGQPLCECGAIATDVDHVTPLAQGGAPYDPANLKAMCSSCHGKKTKREVFS